MACPARGETGKGNIHVHSQKDQRCTCDVCQYTFTTSKGTILYRLRHDSKTVMCVIILLAYGCPVQAIVKALELDERKVSAWHERAGKHCQSVHEHIIEKSQQDLQQVQADDCGRFAHPVPGKFVIIHARNFDVDVYAVEQRAGNALLVLGHC
jgi:transposase-like protein